MDGEVQSKSAANEPTGHTGNDGEPNGTVCSSKAPRKYKGVFPAGRRFRAVMQIDGVRHNLGMHSTEIEAATAYDTFARQHHKKTNFQYPSRQDRAAHSNAPFLGQMQPATAVNGTLVDDGKRANSFMQSSNGHNYQNSSSGAITTTNASNAATGVALRNLRASVWANERPSAYTSSGIQGTPGHSSYDDNYNHLMLLDVPHSAQLYSQHSPHQGWQKRHWQQETHYQNQQRLYQDRLHDPYLPQPQVLLNSHPVVYVPVPLQLSQVVTKYVNDYLRLEQQQQHDQAAYMPSPPPALHPPPILTQQDTSFFSEPTPVPQPPVSAVVPVSGQQQQRAPSASAVAAPLLFGAGPSFVSSTHAAHGRVASSTAPLSQCTVGEGCLDAPALSQDLEGTEEAARGEQSSYFVGSEVADTSNLNGDEQAPLFDVEGRGSGDEEEEEEEGASEKEQKGEGGEGEQGEEDSDCDSQQQEEEDSASSDSDSGYDQPYSAKRSRHSARVSTQPTNAVVDQAENQRRADKAQTGDEDDDDSEVPTPTAAAPDRAHAVSTSTAPQPASKNKKRSRSNHRKLSAEEEANHPAARYVTTIGPRPVDAVRTGEVPGVEPKDTEDWREQVRYYWHGTLVFDPERCVQVWRGSWLGTKRAVDDNGSNDLPTAEAFEATETTFQYLSTKVRKLSVHQSALDNSLVPQSGYFKGYFKMRSTKMKTYIKHQDHDFYLVFEPSPVRGKDKLVHEYALYGRGAGQHGAFIVHGQYSNQTGIMQAVRMYLREDDHRARMSMKQLQAWFQQGGNI